MSLGLDWACETDNRYVSNATNKYFALHKQIKHYDCYFLAITPYLLQIMLNIEPRKP